MKNKKLYLVTYDAKNPTNFNSSTFHNYIKEMDKKGWISDWWHYINNVYIVVSTHTASDLYNEATKGMAGMRHVLIIEIDPKNEQGWLPSKAWEWLAKYK